MRFLVLHVLSVFVVPMVSVRFPWFPWFLCGFYGRYIFSPVSMGSIFFFWFSWFLWILYMFSVGLAVSIVSIGSVQFTCAYVLLSVGTHCGGRRCALPPAPPHPLLFLNRFPLLPTIPFFLHKHHRLFGLISSLLISIETCALCASFLIFSFLLAIYPLRLVPMCFSLGTHCGGRRCALPPAPPHPLLFLNRFPLLPTIPFFLHKHHRLFGLISSLLISIETCASVLLSWSSRSYLQYIHWDLCLCASLLVPPAPPHPLDFKTVPLATYYSFLFA